MLLLRYQVRVLGLDHALQVDSAGLGNSAADADPMLTVAQGAAAHAARLLSLNITAQATSENMSTLRREADQHRSAKVLVDDPILRQRIVVSLLTWRAAQKLDPSRTLHSIASIIHLPIGDNGFRALCKHGRNEAHPAVIAAYCEQADKLARLVDGPLARLFKGVR